MALAFAEHIGGFRVLVFLMLVFLENANVAMVLPVLDRVKYVTMDHVNVGILNVIDFKNS